MSFSSAERRAASMIGQIELSKDGGTWTGHISDPMGNTMLITGRVEQFMGHDRMILLASHGQTREQKALRREEQQSRR